MINRWGKVSMFNQNRLPTLKLLVFSAFIKWRIRLTKSGAVSLSIVYIEDYFGNPIKIKNLMVDKLRRYKTKIMSDIISFSRKSQSAWKLIISTNTL